MATESVEDWFDEDASPGNDMEYRKLQDGIWKEGYREGLNGSKDVKLQRGFEDGFHRSTHMCQPLGELLGRLQPGGTYSAMADDEDYWNSSSVPKAFDFDDATQNDDKLLKMFAVSGPSRLSPAPTDDSDLPSTTSDDVASVKSEGAVEDAKPASFTKKSVERIRSTLSKSSGVSLPSAAGVPRGSTSPTFSTSSKISVRSPKIIQPPEVMVRPRADSDASSSQLMSEVQYLRRNLEVSRKDQWIKLSPKEMVWRILRNKPYGLENYRGLEEKVALLDQALNLYDNNAVVIAVMHMKNTLRHDVFIREMANKPDAVDQYVAYLAGDSRWQDCWLFMEEVARKEEASHLQLQMSLQKQDVQERLRDLDLIVRQQPSSFAPVALPPNLDVYRLRNLKSLLEIQRPIDDNDEKAAREAKNEVFTRFPRLRSLVGLSLMETLHYCCLYHYDKPETSFSSPHYIRKTFAVSERQFLWVALDALSKLQNWNEIQTLLTDRTGWLRAPKPKAAIGFEKVVDVLLRNEAPPEVLAYYLRLIDDPEVRLDLSRKSKCHVVAIDALAALKQFDKLQDYGAKLDPGSPEYEYLQSCLHKIRM